MGLRLFNNKEIKNAGWLIGGKVAQMLLQLIVGALSARYLGPDNYGLIGYATAYVTLFTPLCMLGINSVIIKDFADDPCSQGAAVGSSIVIRAVSSVISVAMIIGFVCVLDRGDHATIYVTALCSIALLFKVFDTINYWFQSRYQSKIPSIISVIAYVVVSVYRVILLVRQSSVYWFALATSVDCAVIAVCLLWAYYQYGGQKLVFSKEKSRSLLSKSHHYILSGMMVAIYGQTDKLMLNYYMSEREVGYYTAATNLCAMWTFVLSAIIDSVYPTIIRLHSTDRAAYERKNRQLYCIVFYVSVFVAGCFMVFGGLAIRILYGADYAPARSPLTMITWYTAFSFLGVARNAWIVCEGKQKYLKYMYMAAAVINICLNMLLIPPFGPTGAAVASLITQIMTSIGLSLLVPAMRPNAKLILQAITFQGIKEKNT